MQKIVARRMIDQTTNTDGETGHAEDRRTENDRSDD